VVARQLKEYFSASICVMHPIPFPFPEFASSKEVNGTASSWRQHVELAM